MSFDEGGWGVERVVGMVRIGAAIPPVVARIFFGRQHLTFDKGGKDMVLSEGGWDFERVVGMERLVGVKQSLR